MSEMKYFLLLGMWLSRKQSPSFDYFEKYYNNRLSDIMLSLISKISIYIAGCLDRLS